jgi:hypothetical protein
MQKDYFDKLQGLSSLFLKAESDGVTDGQKSKLSLGVAAQQRGTDVFVPRGDRTGLQSSIETEGYARFEDDPQDRLIFSQYYTPSEYHHSFDFRESYFGNLGASFEQRQNFTETQWEGFIPKNSDRSTTISKVVKETKSFTDEWSPNDIKLVDDLAVVAYENYTDVHRIDIDLDDLQLKQFSISSNALTAQYSSQVKSQVTPVGSLCGRTAKLGYMDKRNYATWVGWQQDLNNSYPPRTDRTAAFAYNTTTAARSWNLDATDYELKQMNASFAFADFYDSFIRIDFGDFVGYFQYGGPVENTIQHEIPANRFFNNLFNHEDLHYDESPDITRQHQNGTISECTSGKYDRTDRAGGTINFKDGTVMGQFHIVAGSVEQDLVKSVLGHPSIEQKKASTRNYQPNEFPPPIRPVEVALGNYESEWYNRGNDILSPNRVFPPVRSSAERIFNMPLSGPARGDINQKTFTIQLSIQYNPSDTERFVTKESESFQVDGDNNSNFLYIPDGTYNFNARGLNTRVLSALDVSVKSIKFVKFKPLRSCGRVDIYQKKKGIIQYIKYNTITSPSHGLKTNDIISISNVLIPRVEDGYNGYTDFHPLNGKKYVKVIDDNTFEIFDDQFFEKPSHTTDQLPTSLTDRSTEIRNVSAALYNSEYVWAADDLSYTPVGNSYDGESQSWSYYTSLYSPSGRNGYKFKNVEEQPFYSSQRLSINQINMAQKFSAIAGTDYFDDLYRQVPAKWSNYSSSIDHNFLNNPMNGYWCFHHGMHFGSSIDARKKPNGDIEVLVGEQGWQYHNNLFDLKYYARDNKNYLFHDSRAYGLLSSNPDVYGTIEEINEDYTAGYAFDRKMIAPAQAPCGKVHKFTVNRDSYKKISSIDHNFTKTGSDQENPMDEWLDGLYSGSSSRVIQDLHGDDITFTYIPDKYYQYDTTFNLINKLYYNAEKDLDFTASNGVKYFKDFYWVRAAIGTSGNQSSNTISDSTGRYFDRMGSACSVTDFNAGIRSISYSSDLVPDHGYVFERQRSGPVLRSASSPNDHSIYDQSHYTTSTGYVKMPWKEDPSRTVLQPVTKIRYLSRFRTGAETELDARGFYQFGLDIYNDYISKKEIFEANEADYIYGIKNDITAIKNYVNEYYRNLEQVGKNQFASSHPSETKAKWPEYNDITFPWRRMISNTWNSLPEDQAIFGDDSRGWSRARDSGNPEEENDYLYYIAQWLDSPIGKRYVESKGLFRDTPTGAVLWNDYVAAGRRWKTFQNTYTLYFHTTVAPVFPYVGEGVTSSTSWKTHSRDDLPEVIQVNPVKIGKSVYDTYDRLVSRDSMCWVDGFGRAVSFNQSDGSFVASSFAVSQDVPQVGRPSVNGSYYRIPFGSPAYENAHGPTHHPGSMYIYDSDGNYVSILHTQESIDGFDSYSLDSVVNENLGTADIAGYRKTSLSVYRLNVAFSSLRDLWGRTLNSYAVLDRYGDNILYCAVLFKFIESWIYGRSISSRLDVTDNGYGFKMSKDGNLRAYRDGVGTIKVKRGGGEYGVIEGRFSSFSILDNTRIIASRETTRNTTVDESILFGSEVAEGGIEIYEPNLDPRAGTTITQSTALKRYFGYSENITYDDTTKLTYDYFSSNQEVFTTKMAAGQSTIGIQNSCQVPVLFFDADIVDSIDDIDSVEITFDIIEEDIASRFDFIKSNETGEPYTLASISPDNIIPRLVVYRNDPRKTITINEEPNTSIVGQKGQSIERIWNEHEALAPLYSTNKLPIAKNWSTKYSDTWRFSPETIPILEWYFQPKFRGGAQDLFFYDAADYSMTLPSPLDANLNIVRYNGATHKNSLAKGQSSYDGGAEDLLVPPPAGPANPNGISDINPADISLDPFVKPDFGLYPLGFTHSVQHIKKVLNQLRAGRFAYDDPNGNNSLGWARRYPYEDLNFQSSSIGYDVELYQLKQLKRLYTAFNTDEYGYDPENSPSNDPYAKLFMPTATENGYKVTIPAAYLKSTLNNITPPRVGSAQIGKGLLMTDGLQRTPRSDGNLHEGSDFNDVQYLSEKYRRSDVVSLAIGFLMTNYTEYSMNRQNAVRLDFNSDGTPSWSSYGGADGVDEGVHTSYPSASKMPADLITRKDIRGRLPYVHHKEWEEITDQVLPSQISDGLDNLGPLTSLTFGARYPYQNHCNFYNWSEVPFSEFPEHVWEGSSIDYDLSASVKNITVKINTSKFMSEWKLVANDKDINFNGSKSHTARVIAVEQSGGQDDPTVDVFFACDIDEPLPLSVNSSSTDLKPVLGSFTVLKESTPATNTMPMIPALSIGNATHRRINKFYELGHDSASGLITMRTEGFTGINSGAPIFIGQKLSNTGVLLFSSAPDATGDMSLFIREVPPSAEMPLITAAPDAFAGLPLIADSPATSSVPLVSFGPFPQTGGIPLSWVPSASGNMTFKIAGIGGFNSGTSLQVDAVENVNNALGITFAPPQSGNIALHTYGAVPASGSTSLVMKDPFGVDTGDMFIKMVSTHNSDIEGSPRLFIKPQRYSSTVTELFVKPQVFDSSVMPTYINSQIPLSGDADLLVRGFYESGNATLVMKTIDRTPQSGASLYLEDTYGVMPIHINQLPNPDALLHIKGKPAIYNRTMTMVLDAAYHDDKTDLFMDGHLPFDSGLSLAFFDVTSGSGYKNTTSLFMGKEIHENNQASLFMYNDKFNPASDGQPSENAIPLAMSGGFASGVDGEMGLFFNSEISDDVTNSVSLMVNVEEPVIGTGGGFVSSGNVTVVIAGNNDANVYFRDNFSSTLNIKNRDTQSNSASLVVPRMEEFTSTMFIQSFYNSGDINVYISGANLGTGIAPLYIASPETETAEFFTRGYLE